MRSSNDDDIHKVFYNLPNKNFIYYLKIFKKY